MPLLFFCFKTLLLFPKNNCYFCTLCFVFLTIVIWIFSTVACIGLTTKGFLFTFMVGPWNSFYIIWKGGRMFWDLIYQELPAKGKAFFQCWVSPTILASVTKLTLKINMKCQNVASITGAKQIIFANIFFKFLKNFHHDHSMHYHQYILTVLF